MMDERNFHKNMRKKLFVQKIKLRNKVLDSEQSDKGEENSSYFKIVDDDELI
jgi:hypothetical protein